MRVEPAPGVKLASSGILNLFVSLGEPLVLVPDLYALSVEEAETRLESLNLIVKDPEDAVSVNDELVPVGFTVGVDLPVSTYELEVGSQVRLLVSAGPADRLIPFVPSDRSFVAAERALQDAGFCAGEG